MITEEEARKKWCHLLMPTVLSAALKCDPLTTSMKTAEQMTETGMCVASECMAWEWWEPTSGTVKNLLGAQEVAGIESPFKVGDCGLKRK